MVVLPLYVMTSFMDQLPLGYCEASLWSGLIAGSPLAKRLTVQQRLAPRRFLSLILHLYFVWPFVSSGSICCSLAAGVLWREQCEILNPFQQIVPASIKGSFFAIMQGLISACYP